MRATLDDSSANAVEYTSTPISISEDPQRELALLGKEQNWAAHRIFPIRST
jgi:hypothetical protein